MNTNTASGCAIFDESVYANTHTNTYSKIQHFHSSRCYADLSSATYTLILTLKHTHIYIHIYYTGYPADFSNTYKVTVKVVIKTSPDDENSLGAIRPKVDSRFAKLFLKE